MFALLLVFVAAAFLAGAFFVAALVAVFFAGAFLVAVLALAGAFFAIGLLSPALDGAASFTGPDVPVEGGEVSDMLTNDDEIGKSEGRG